ncbi:MAG: SigE family polymerase sigma factor [Acidimicrobiales bacterium]|nr:SigE family polymerase sigma factor [Acidimicrobiales bacterium]
MKPVRETPRSGDLGAVSTKGTSWASVRVMMAVVGTPSHSDVTEAAELRDLYESQRTSLVRLASLLLHDVHDAEEVVQDAFVKAYVRWGRLREPDRALAYLRSAVLNGARSRLRHLRVVERTAPDSPPLGVSADANLLVREEHERVIDALRSLPARQRECLALRYYLELSEAEIASTLGISQGSVKTHVHRGLASLAGRLEPTP